MNQHERRAAEARARAAQADKGFDIYSARARRAFPDIDDKTIGEGWMRGQAWAVSGIKRILIHRPDEAPIRVRMTSSSAPPMAS
jgi:hypothetical protein